MTTVVPKLVGTGGDYTSLSTGWTDWEAAKPSNFTTSRSNTCQVNVTNTQIILDAAASASNDFYTGHPVWANARPTEIRLITAYDGTTKIATIGAYRDPTTESASSATWGTTPSLEAFTIDSCIWDGRGNNVAFSAAGTLCTIAGSTDSATQYAQMSTAIGAGFRDNANKLTNKLQFNTANGCALTGSGAYAAVVALNESNCHMKNLQIQHTNANNRQAVGVGASGPVIAGCIVEMKGTAAAVNNVGGTFSATVQDTLVMTRNASGDGISMAGGGVFKMNTVVKCSNFTVGGNAYVMTAATTAITNCAGFGFTNFSSGASSFSGNNNCSDTTIGFGTSNQASKTYANQFNQSSDSGGNQDFQLKTGSDCIVNGVADLTDDIVGTTRANPPCISAWEFASAAPSVTWGWGQSGQTQPRKEPYEMVQY